MRKRERKRGVEGGREKEREKRKKRTAAVVMDDIITTKGRIFMEGSTGNRSGNFVEEDERSQKCRDRVAIGRPSVCAFVRSFICVPGALCEVLRVSLLTRLRKLLAQADTLHTYETHIYKLVLFGALRTRTQASAAENDDVPFRRKRKRKRAEREREKGKKRRREKETRITRFLVFSLSSASAIAYTSRLRSNL